jgi:hypothetical protein
MTQHYFDSSPLPASHAALKKKIRKNPVNIKHTFPCSFTSSPFWE